jgi:hypothetical protein
MRDASAVAVGCLGDDPCRWLFQFDQDGSDDFDDHERGADNSRTTDQRNVDDLPHSTTSKATSPPTTTATTQPHAAASCKAIVSNPTPGTSGTETVSFTSAVPNGSVKRAVHYKTTNTPQAGSTGAGGSGQITFKLGTPTAGYTAQVDVTISGAAGTANCVTSFTPQ